MMNTTNLLTLQPLERSLSILLRKLTPSKSEEGKKLITVVLKLMRDDPINIRSQYLLGALCAIRSDLSPDVAQDLLTLALFRIRHGSWAYVDVSLAQCIPPGSAENTAGIILESMSVAGIDQTSLPRGAFNWLARMLSSLPGELTPATAERAYAMIIRRLESTGDPSEFEELCKALSHISGYLDNARIVNILKYPMCVGASRLPLLKLMEKRLDRELGDSAWNLVSQASQKGMDSGQFRYPPQRASRH